MQQQKWFERKFSFGLGSDRFPGIYLRLTKSVAELMDLVALVNDDQLTVKPDGKWSVKENIGRLFLLEKLWYQRFLDILENKEVLTVADLQNAATDEANFNAYPLAELIQLFSNERGKTLFLLESTTNSVLQQTSLHPRLRLPMNMVDHASFVAEHDIHHFEAIREVLRNSLERPFKVANRRSHDTQL